MQPVKVLREMQGAEKANKLASWGIGNEVCQILPDAIDGSGQEFTGLLH
jgi:hypothetical protein